MKLIPPAKRPIPPVRRRPPRNPNPKRMSKPEPKPEPEPVCYFLDRLPAELRDMIYEYDLTFEHRLHDKTQMERETNHEQVDLAILLLNKQVHQEALAIFHKVNKFSIHRDNLCIAQKFSLDQNYSNYGRKLISNESFVITICPRLLTMRDLYIRNLHFSVGDESDATLFGPGPTELIAFIREMPFLKTLTIACAASGFEKFATAMREYTQQSSQDNTMTFRGVEVGKIEVTGFCEQFVIVYPELAAAWKAAYVLEINLPPRVPPPVVLSTTPNPRMSRTLMRLIEYRNCIHTHFGTLKAVESFFHPIHVDDSGILPRYLTLRGPDDESAVLLAKFSIALASQLKRSVDCHTDFRRPRMSMWSFAEGVKAAEDSCKYKEKNAIGGHQKDND